MIKSKAILKEYINADRSRYKLQYPTWIGLFLKNEATITCDVLKTVRYLEYYTNIRKNPIQKLAYLYYKVSYIRKTNKYGLHIPINVVGKGLYIPHIVGGVILNALHVGDYCTINSGVILGNKKDGEMPFIGDNVELTIGCKVIGNVKVGNNAIVAPNSVVVKDVDHDTIVSGVPAKFLKRR